MSPWKVVFAKELKETLRDRRTLLTMIVVPILLYPMLLIVMEQLLLFGMRSLEAEASPVAVVGDVPRELAGIVAAEERLRRVPIGGDPERAIRTDAVTAVAIVGANADADGTRDVTLLYDASSDRSNRGRAALSGAIAVWRDSLLAGRLDGRGLPRSFALPLAVADSSIARPDEVGGYTLGRILPLLLVVITLLGAFYPAIDLAAGEKERGTLETLLTAPVPARSIVAGKFVTVALIGVVAAGLNLGSMILTFQTGVLQLTTVMGLEFVLPLSSVLVIFVTLIPLAVLFGALFLGIAVGSSSFKEAQSALTPVYMIALVPAMLPIFPGIDFGPWLAVTPVAGVSFLFRDVMNGDANAFFAALALLSTTAYAALALAFASRAFGSERVLFGGDAEDADVGRGSLFERWRARRARRSVPDPLTSLLFVAIMASFSSGVGSSFNSGSARPDCSPPSGSSWRFPCFWWSRSRALIPSGRSRSALRPPPRWARESSSSPGRFPSCGSSVGSRPSCSRCRGSSWKDSRSSSLPTPPSGSSGSSFYWP